MKTPLTIGQFIAFLVFVIPSSIFWAINAEKTHKQVEQNKIDIIEAKKLPNKNEEKITKINETIFAHQLKVINELGEIKLLLKNKKDRK